jgi:hypothetical protein
MYANELFNQGLTGCIFVCGDKVLSYCCHNSYSLYVVVICDLAVVYERTFSVSSLHQVTHLYRAGK